MLHAYKKDAHARVTNIMIASMLDSRMAKCPREILILWTMAAQSAPALLEEAGSAATTSAVLTCHQTASTFQSLRMVACSANASGVSMAGRSTRLDTLSTLTPAGSATAPMKEGS